MECILKSLLALIATLFLMLSHYDNDMLTVNKHLLVETVKLQQHLHRLMWKYLYTGDLLTDFIMNYIQFNKTTPWTINDIKQASPVLQCYSVFREAVLW